jgi:chromosome segregation ATPase
MTKYKWPIIIGVVSIVLLGYVLWNPPSTKDKLNFWRGQYDELKRITTADEQIKLATIAELESKNSLLQSSIDSANTVIANLEGKQADKDTALLKLEQTLTQAKTDAERVPILTQMVEEWRGKFNLAQAQIAEKDKIIFSLTTQYQTALSIGAEYKGLWQSEKTLRLKAETGLNLADKRIASLNRQVKTWRVVAVVGVIATAVLKK